MASATFAQDDTDLIDDSPKERKEATKENVQPPRKAKGGDRRPLGRPKVDLIDDLSPEQKEAAARNAAPKNENAIPDTLADALARALRNNPGILVAEAKVRQSQAELNEVRLGVVQELTLAFQRRAMNKVIPPGELSTLTIIANMEDETKILYLLGVGAEQASEAPQASAGRRAKGGLGAGMMGGGMGAMPGTGMGMGAMPGMGMGMGMPAMGGGMGPMESMRPMGGGMGGMMRGPAMGGGPTGGQMTGGMGGGAKAQAAEEWQPSDLPKNVTAFLKKRLDVDMHKMPLADVLEYLQAAAAGEVAFIIEAPEEWKMNPEGADGNPHAVTLSLKQVTVRSALQALADLHHCAFVFRDYGILVLGPNVEGTDSFESFRGAGTHMIAPPSGAPAFNGPRMGGGGMGGGGMSMGGIGGAAPAAGPVAPPEKSTDE
jgi:hypothetical protein